MTRDEARAIQTFYEAMRDAEDREISLGYLCDEKREYYKNTSLTMKKYNFLKKYLFEFEEDEANKTIEIIADYVSLII